MCYIGHYTSHFGKHTISIQFLSSITELNNHTNYPFYNKKMSNYFNNKTSRIFNSLQVMNYKFFSRSFRYYSCFITYYVEEFNTLFFSNNYSSHFQARILKYIIFLYNIHVNLIKNTIQINWIIINFHFMKTS